MKNWNTKWKYFKWNTSKDFIEYMNWHWISKKDWALMLILLKDFIAESTLVKWKLTLSWIGTFKKIFVQRGSLKYRYVHFKQSSYIKSLIKIK